MVVGPFTYRNLVPVLKFVSLLFSSLAYLYRTATVGTSSTATQTELTLSPEDTVIVVPRVCGVLRLEAFPEPQE